MENEGSVPIVVYSSITNSMIPEYFSVNETTTVKSLVTTFLKRLRVQLTDPNLITVWKIKLTNNLEVKSEIINGMSELLKENDQLITAAHFLEERYFNYYLSFEKGLQIKVFITDERNNTSCKVVLISKFATANLVINLLNNSILFPKQCILNLQHKTEGLLKGNENIFNLIRNSKSNDFFLEMKKPIKYEEFVKIELLKKLRLDYERKRSKSLENKDERSYNDLSKIIYHNDHQNHRKLPDIISVLQDKTQYPLFQNSTKIKDIQSTSKRSLPVPPPLVHQLPESKLDHVKYSPNIKKFDKPETNKGHPPEPILKTNALDELKSSSSASSFISSSEDNSTKENHNQKQSVYFKSDNNSNNQQFTNLYEIVKHCDLHAIELIKKEGNTNSIKIEFNETSFTDFIVHYERRPKGPNPTLGRGSSAFKSIEPSNEKKRSLVLLVTDVIYQNSSLNMCNIKNRDIFVEIDNENVLCKTKEYINSKLSNDRKQSVVIARLKTESKSNKEKDQKINKLKSELEALKMKYSDLHHVTIDNDQLIQQLTKLLKKEEINHVLNNDEAK